MRASRTVSGFRPGPMENQLSDLLSASSLLLAVVGVLYGLWYAEIHAALDLPVDRHPENNQVAFDRATSALITRAIPLALMAATLGLIFLPDMVTIFSESWSLYKALRLSPSHYDAVRTAFCLVVIFSLSIGAHTAALVFRLMAHRSKLNPKRKP